MANPCRARRSARAPKWHFGPLRQQTPRRTVAACRLRRIDVGLSCGRLGPRAGPKPARQAGHCSRQVRPLVGTTRPAGAHSPVAGKLCRANHGNHGSAERGPAWDGCRVGIRAARWSSSHADCGGSHCPACRCGHRRRFAPSGGPVLALHTRPTAAERELAGRGSSLTSAGGSLRGRQPRARLV